MQPQAPTPTTKLSEAEAESLTHDSYLMYIYTQSCNCGSGERWSQIFEVWTHPTKTRLSGHRVLRPSVASMLRKPLACIELPEVRIPMCSDCVDDSPALLAEPVTHAANSAAWAETLKRKYTPLATTEAPKAKVEPTLDQL